MTIKDKTVCKALNIPRNEAFSHQERAKDLRTFRSKTREHKPDNSKTGKD